MFEFESFEKKGIGVHFVPYCLCHYKVLIHFTSAYHKTLECLEMTRRGQGPSGGQQGNKGSIMIRKSQEITFERHRSSEIGAMACQQLTRETRM